MMIKHGWTPFLTTQYPIYGPSRLPGFSAYGRFSCKKPSMKSFKKIISNGKKETIESVKIDLNILNI